MELVGLPLTLDRTQTYAWGRSSKRKYVYGFKTSHFRQPPFSFQLTDRTNEHDSKSKVTIYNLADATVFLLEQSRQVPHKSH